MPLYLKSIGFSALLIGVLEGFAEATAGLSKGYFGNMSDRTGKRKPFVQIGYGLSAISKPMIAIFIFPVWIFFARALDRLGKGIRTSARDTILSDESTTETKGRIFGLHRGLDTAGAFIGPLLALLFLSLYAEKYSTLFLIAFIPGALAILLSALIKENKHTGTASINSKSFLGFLKYWNISSAEYKRLIVGLLFFSLINSSDIFLLLRMKDIGFGSSNIIIIYIFYNFIYAITSFPMGIAADKIGLKNIFVIGLLLFSFVYGGMALQPSLVVIFGLFFVYALYASATESISKAWITNVCKKEDTATAIGFFTSLSSIFTLIASTLAGLLWVGVSPSAPFAVTAFGGIILILYFTLIFRGKK